MENAVTHSSLLTALSSDNRASLRGLFQPNSPSDRAIVTQHLLDAERELGDYNINIAILLAKRQRLVRQIERCKSLLAPINKIPPEILCSIFGVYCEKNYLPSPRIAEALTVSAVCHRWRRIVLSTPELWSSLHIDLSYWIRDRHKLPYIVQIFMERSQTCPLQISFVGYPGSAWSDIAGHTLKVLTDNSSRWFSLDLSRAPVPVLQNRALKAARGNLPRLSYLNLGSEGMAIPDDIFADAPSLSSVIYSPKLDPATAKFPFEQLKFLELRECHSVDAILALKRCVNLEKLELCNVGCDLDGDVPRVILPNVKVLKVVVKKKRNISFVFGHLTLPQLTSMEIRGCKLIIEEPTWSDLDDLTAIRRFFHESSCNITAMRLCKLPASREQILNLLTFMPMLQTLYIKDLDRRTLKNRIVTPNFLRQLTVKDEDSPAIIPHLTDLTLISDFNGSNVGALVEAVWSRCILDNTWRSANGVASLQAVEILSTAGSDLPDALLSLEALRASGLKVRVEKHINKALRVARSFMAEHPEYSKPMPRSVKKGL